MCKHRVAGFSAAHRVGMSLLLCCLLFPPACSEATLQDHAVAAWVGPTCCLMFWGVLSCACVFLGRWGVRGQRLLYFAHCSYSVGSGPSSACGVYVGAGPPA